MEEKLHLLVKIYASNRHGIKSEIEVYSKLGHHPSFSYLYGHGDNFLILKRLRGLTLFDAVRSGVFIPNKVIDDINLALLYSKKVGLNPQDVHGKNVIKHKGRGYVVDVSDFLKVGHCQKWEHLVKAYDKFYFPFFKRKCYPVPYFVLNGIRKGYQKYNMIFRKKVRRLM